MAKKGNGNKGNGNKNRQIQKAMRSAGKTVDYKEASQVAQKFGVSVNRVYNQTANTGQRAHAGAAAAKAGYVPGSNLKVGNPIAPTYVRQSQINYNNQLATAQEQWAAQQAGGGDGSAVPEFDWDAWNQQMAAQQAAVWASMDAMNAQFLQQQQEWQAAQQQQQPPWYNTKFGVMTSGGDRGGFGQDSPKVRRAKKKRNANNQIGSKLTIGGSNANSTSVSTGGAKAGGLNI